MMTTKTSRSSLAERINSETLLTSEELFDYFAKVQFLLDDCLRTISATSPVIAMTILEIGSEVVAKLQRNKSLFRRRVNYVELEGSIQLKDASMSPDVEHDGFLLDCFDLARCVVHKEPLAPKVENMRLSRMFAERFVRAWVSDTATYIDSVWDAASTYDTNKDAYITATTNAMGISHEASLPAHGFGLIQYVQDRLNAVDQIYSHITQAYARVILKVAKVHSINDDHFLELFQFGFFGLSRANSSYDYILNAKYVAVAKWWVRQAILFYMKSSSGIIKISPSTWQHRAKMDHVRQRIMLQKGEATVEDIAEALGHTPAYVASVYEAVRVAKVDDYDAATHDVEVEGPDQSPEWDLMDALSKIEGPGKVYCSLLYSVSLPSMFVGLKKEEIKLHKLRQQVAFRLT